MLWNLEFCIGNWVFPLVWQTKRAPSPLSRAKLARALGPSSSFQGAQQNSQPEAKAMHEPICALLSNICTKLLDWHSATKFISKDYDLEIVMRDRNHFHHFKYAIKNSGDKLIGAPNVCNSSSEKFLIFLSGFWIAFPYQHLDVCIPMSTCWLFAACPVSILTNTNTRYEAFLTKKGMAFFCPTRVCVSLCKGNRSSYQK